MSCHQDSQVYYQSLNKKFLCLQNQYVLTKQRTENPVGYKHIEKYFASDF